MNKQSETPIIIWILIGLSFFVPFVGVILAFVALVFTILNHYKYKTIMIILSICGMLFPIVFVSVIYMTFNKHGGAMEKAFKDAAESQLTTLVKEIEYYNIQNGRYPDSLPQLSKNGTFVTTFDPIQSRIKSKNSNYYYSRVDSGYFLFSAGYDGLPFTTDDILPIVSCEEAQRIGILKCTIDSLSK